MTCYKFSVEVNYTIILTFIVFIDLTGLFTSLDSELFESRMRVHCLASQKEFIILLNIWMLFKCSGIQIYLTGVCFHFVLVLHLYKRWDGAL